MLILTYREDEGDGIAYVPWEKMAFYEITYCFRFYVNINALINEV